MFILIAVIVIVLLVVGHVIVHNKKKFNADMEKYRMILRMLDMNEEQFVQFLIKLKIIKEGVWDLYSVQL